MEQMEGVGARLEVVTVSFGEITLLFLNQSLINRQIKTLLPVVY